MTIAPDDIPALLEALRQGTEHLTNMAKGLEFPWRAEPKTPRRLHNMYARNLITCCVSKFSELSLEILEAVERSNLLVYALLRPGLVSSKPRRPFGTTSPRSTSRHSELFAPHFSGKKGNSFRISSSVGCRPYSQISNASAYLAALPLAGPYRLIN
jgi:hypothetical protein